MTTLQDLIQKGIELHKARREAEALKLALSREREKRERQAAEQAILSLLPEPLREFSEIEFMSGMLNARVFADLPSGGVVKIYAQQKDGQWTIKSPDDDYSKLGVPTYDGINPSGYYRRFLTIEEAIAYASGEIND